MTVDIALLCEWPTLNGGERSMLSTLEGVCAAGLRMAALAPPDGPLADALRGAGIEVEPFLWRAADGARRPQAELRTQLAERLASIRPRLLHANSLAAAVVAGPVAAQLGLPSIGHLRDIIRLSRQAVADLNCHTRLLAVSHATREYHVARGLRGDATHVLYNGVDLERFRPHARTGSLHGELGLPAGCPLVVTIGQVGMRKGQDTLLQAAALLGEWREAVHYLIVGEQNSRKPESCRYVQQLHDLADARLSGRVRFLGTRADVAELLNEATLLVHAARQEPLGRVLLEGAAAGTAIVATDVGGTREILPVECDAAILVQPDDVEALAGAMRSLLGDEARRMAIGLAARRRAEAVFDVRRATANLISHYSDLLG